MSNSAVEVGVKAAGGGHKEHRTEVTFTDAQNRKICFRLSSCGSLALLVDGRQKVQQIRDLRVVGSTVHFNGKGLMTTEKQATLPEDGREQLAKELEELGLRAEKKVLRCFVEVLRAECLRGADVLGSSDPYVICGVPGKESSRDHTKYKNRTLNPVWNETLEIIDYKIGEALEFLIMDHDYMSADDFLGSAEVTSSMLDSNRCYAGTLDLKDDGKHGSVGKKAQGKVEVRVMLSGGELPEAAAADASREAPAAEKGAPTSSTIAVQTSVMSLSIEEVEMKVVEEFDEEERQGSRQVRTKTEAEEADELEDYRASLAKSVFAGLDRKKQGKLGSWEIRALAGMLGFVCEDDEWDVEFKEVAAARTWNVEDGATQAQFLAFVDEEGETAPASCNNAVLEDLAAELSKQAAAAEAGTVAPARIVASVWKRSEKTKAFLEQKPRQELIQQTFDLLDDKKTGKLSQEHMLRYAQMFGFDGSEEEWDVEFDCMAEEYGFDRKEGVDFEKFSMMVNNPEDGAYADEDGLRSTIARLKDGGHLLRTPSMYPLRKATLDFRSKMPQAELIQVLFNALDETGSGRLGPSELHKYAEMCGFNGTDEDWAVEYAEMCNEFNINPRSGADLQQFTKIVHNKAGQGDATGVELADMVEHAKAQAAIRRGNTLQTSRSKREFTRQVTWKPVADNFTSLRRFGLFLRKVAADPDSAYAQFTDKRFGRLSREEFIEGLDKLKFDGDRDSIFKLLALGSPCILKKHFKWAWGLLDAEELVLERSRLRSHTAQSIAKLKTRSRLGTEAFADVRKMDQGPISATEMVGVIEEEFVNKGVSVIKEESVVKGVSVIKEESTAVADV